MYLISLVTCLGVLPFASGPGLASESLAAAPRPAVFLRADRTLQASIELARDYPSAVRVGSIGSGTLIAPRWVLTAAHVNDALWPGTGHVHVGDRAYAIETTFLHPLGRSPALGQPPEVDLALIRLAKPVEGVTPVPLSRGPCAVGDAVTLVGFGDYALAGADPSPPDGIARAATNLVAEIRDLRLVLRLDKNGTELEGVGAPGDSGGPLYGDADGTRQLVGVSSGGDGPWGDYGMRDIYVSVSVFREWIVETMARVDGASGSGDPQTASAWRATDAPPQTTVGGMVSAFFKALDSGSVEALTSFGKARRSVAAEHMIPSPLWARELAPIRGALDSVHIARYAETDRRAVALVRLVGDDGWLHVWFDLDEEGRLDALVLSPGGGAE